jgi:hypothetical protein
VPNRNQGRNRQQGGGGNQAKKAAKAQEKLMTAATPKQIRREARGATRAQYGPLVREIKQEKKASNLQQKRISDYFPQYGQSLDQSAARTASAYQTAGDSIRSDSASATAYAEQLRSKLAGEEQADAAKRGVSYDPSGSQTNAAAQLARINAANVLTGVTASHGATQQAYLADKKAIGSREEIEQHLRETARQNRYNRQHPNAGEAGNREAGEVSAALGKLRAAPKGAYANEQEAYEFLTAAGISPRAAHAAITRARRRAGGGDSGPGPHRG